MLINYMDSRLRAKLIICSQLSTGEININDLKYAITYMEYRLRIC